MSIETAERENVEIDLLGYTFNVQGDLGFDLVTHDYIADPQGQGVKVIRRRRSLLNQNEPIHHERYPGLLSFVRRKLGMPSEILGENIDLPPGCENREAMRFMLNNRCGTITVNSRRTKTSLIRDTLRYSDATVALLTRSHKESEDLATALVNDGLPATALVGENQSIREGVPLANCLDEFPSRLVVVSDQAIEHVDALIAKRTFVFFDNLDRALVNVWHELTRHQDMYCRIFAFATPDHRLSPLNRDLHAARLGFARCLVPRPGGIDVPAAMFAVRYKAPLAKGNKNQRSQVERDTKRNEFIAETVKAIEANKLYSIPWHESNASSFGAWRRVTNGPITLLCASLQHALVFADMQPTWSLLVSSGVNDSKFDNSFRERLKRARTSVENDWATIIIATTAGLCDQKRCFLNKSLFVWAGATEQIPLMPPWLRTADSGQQRNLMIVDFADAGSYMLRNAWRKRNALYTEHRYHKPPTSWQEECETKSLARMCVPKKKLKSRK